MSGKSTMGLFFKIGFAISLVSIVAALVTALVLAMGKPPRYFTIAERK